MAYSPGDGGTSMNANNAVDEDDATCVAGSDAHIESQQPLTDKRIKALKAPGRKPTMVPDGTVPGMYLRISVAGKKTWLATYRIRGDHRMVYHTFAEYPDTSLGKARELARHYRSQAKLGIDPRPQPKPVVEMRTVADLCQDYLDNHAIHKRASSQYDDKDMIAKYIKPALGKLTVAEVSRFNIEGLLNQIGRTTKGNHPYRANRVRSLLSTMFNRAVEVHNWITRNPVIGTVKFPEHARKRYLDTEEAQRLIGALSSYKDQSVGNAIALMMFTGCRSGEALSATWDQFLKTNDRVIWRKPSAHTKQKRDHHVPLNPYAIEVLKRIKEHNEPDQVQLFPSRDGKMHITTIKKSWKTILTAAKIADHPEYGRFRIHDLRHSFASLLINKGVSLDAIGQLLGHTKISTTYRYAHLSTDTMSEATNRLSQALPALEFSKTDKASEVQAG
jgi:integrase